ncbi:hypothetical protein [Calothrix sp. UHCC 0171]|uniref:hypothetical protein n=1 Tax=Calothrix sp. UHCC 0171 TaxID=3110245 RepID=UPI002B1ED18D|nr:hypothetical protein [Calothrix sp. UHCC 0171]MEA5571113.1 hypothetical protein [Calothrix sp. UHCC 0171]
MIHHISIAAHHPQHVAQVLAEVLKANVAPFPPHPGSYFVIPFDEQGTAIEVYPLGSELLPGDADEQCHFRINDRASEFTATHAAISVPVSREEIEEIGKREGWRVVYCDRESFFDVIEFWVENRLMIEFLTPQMASKYLKFATNRENLQLFMAAPELSVSN